MLYRKCVLMCAMYDNDTLELKAYSCYTDDFKVESDLLNCSWCCLCLL